MDFRIIEKNVFKTGLLGLLDSLKFKEKEKMKPQTSEI
jgi:hypothetical protein